MLEMLEILEIDKIGKTGESTKSYFSSIFMNIFVNDYCRCLPSIPRSKGLGMTNLQYEIRICQKHRLKVTTSIVS